MARRGITFREVEEALANVHQTRTTPQDSTCIVGSTSAGRVLKIWIVGTAFPPSNETMILKSVAGRDEEDD